MPNIITTKMFSWPMVLSKLQGKRFCRMISNVFICSVSTLYFAKVILIETSSTAASVYACTSEIRHRQTGVTYALSSAILTAKLLHDSLLAVFTLKSLSHLSCSYHNGRKGRF